MHQIPVMLAEESPNPISYDQRALWARVMEQAVDDLRGAPEMTDKYSRHRKSIRQLSAQAWFNSRRHDLGSFLWICDVLHVDPARIRRELLYAC